MKEVEDIGSFYCATREGEQWNKYLDCFFFTNKGETSFLIDEFLLEDEHKKIVGSVDGIGFTSKEENRFFKCTIKGELKKGEVSKMICSQYFKSSLEDFEKEFKIEKDWEII